MSVLSTPAPARVADIAATRIAQRASARWDVRFAARLAAHLTLAALPVLGISADVFGWVHLHVLAAYVLLPLAAAVAFLVVRDRDPRDLLILSAFAWGVLACGAYDAFRLPTIYLAHWWGDFFGSVGGWAVGERSNFAVGYLWRYVGDGGGIAIPFFVLMAWLPAALTGTKRRSLLLGVAYGVCPVWTGLVLTDLFAPAGRELFPLTATTLGLSLVGHLIYGAVLGLGCWHSRQIRQHFPFAFGH